MTGELYTIRNKAYDPPPEMAQGSEGPAIREFLIILVDCARMADLDPTGVSIGEYFGPDAAKLLEKYQLKHGLEPSGVCDLETRAKMRSDGFRYDLYRAWLCGLRRDTKFVQADGSERYWTPRFKPQDTPREDEDESATDAR